eukprot:jgi/Ulvmu1/7936/UM004_0169.1
MDDFIKAGDNIVLDINSSKYAFIRLRDDGTVKIAGHTCSSEPLLGARFGSAFVLDEDKCLTPTDVDPHAVITTASTTERNNADLVAGDNQKLTHEEIRVLKKEKHGADIIKALESGSSTFAGKTEFSQEKWLKKKAKKYLHYIVARRPTSSLICQVYFSTTPLRVYNLRPDTLAVMTCLADIGPHARVMCLDATGGIVAAACAERMGGTGTLACVHAERVPYVLDAVRLLNVSPWLPPSTRSISLLDLLAAGLQEPAPDGADSAPADIAQDTAKDDRDADLSAGAADGTAAASAPCVASPPHRRGGDAQRDEHSADPAAATAPDAAGHAAGQGEERGGPRAGGGSRGAQHKTQFRLHAVVPEGARVPDAVIAATKEEVSEVAAAGFTSLVLAAPRLEPARLLRAVQGLLLPSAAVVVFSQSLQPLAECFQALQESREFASLQLQESWCREMQVLPARTHPRMTTSGAGGFLLSGIRVVNTAKPESASQPATGKSARPMKKRKVRL